jgi:hypothetical protein
MLRHVGGAVKGNLRAWLPRFQPGLFGPISRG